MVAGLACKASSFPHARHGIISGEEEIALPRSAAETALIFAPVCRKSIARWSTPGCPTTTARHNSCIAGCDHAPLNVIEKLALDDEIDVAGPVLRDSTRIDEKMLVQSALTKAYRHWGKVRRSGVPEAYVRRILVNERNSRWRRERFRHHEIVGDIPDRAGLDETQAYADRD